MNLPLLFEEWCVFSSGLKFLEKWCFVMITVCLLGFLQDLSLTHYCTIAAQAETIINRISLKTPQLLYSASRPISIDHLTFLEHSMLLDITFLAQSLACSLTCEQILRLTSE